MNKFLLFKLQACAIRDVISLTNFWLTEATVLPPVITRQSAGFSTYVSQIDSRVKAMQMAFKLLGLIYGLGLFLPLRWYQRQTSYGFRFITSISYNPFLIYIQTLTVSSLETYCVLKLFSAISWIQGCLFPQEESMVTRFLNQPQKPI